MKKLLAVAMALVLTSGAFADTKEEREFKKNGPTLYTMDQALALQQTSGRPVLCWMGPHLFSEADARQLSKSLGTTTLQAAMDSDGEEGKIDPKTGKPIPVFRVKFSTNNYKDGETIYVPLSRMSEPGMAEKILAKVRGGK